MEDTGQCVQCGMCCSQCACIYGTWDEQRNTCVFLTNENKCGKYAEIVEYEKKSSFQMFGAGCSSVMFNSVRDKILNG